MHPEVLIIGGGVIGLSIARELHKQGIKRITLLEKGRCGEEAAWAAAGMLTPQVEAGGPGPFFDLCCSSRDVYPAFANELLDETGIDIELDQTGTLYLAFSDDEVSDIHKRFEWQSKAGLVVKNLSANEAKCVESSASQHVRQALYFPKDWQVENRKLLTALKHYAEIHGIDIRENISAEKLVVEGGCVVGAETLAGPVTADMTLLATGAWTSLIKLGPVEMPFEVEPVRGQIIVFRPAERVIKHVICSSSGYMVPRMDGRILAGSTTEKVGFDKSVSETASTELKEMVCKLVPRLADLEVTDQWAGLRPYVLDGLPVLGSVNDIKSLFIATAHYRNGILLAPLTAKIAAEKLVKGSDSEYFTFFGADRFKLRSVSTRS